MQLPWRGRKKAPPIVSDTELLAGLLPDLRRWAELWEVPGLERKVEIRFSRRLQVSLGRCTPARASIRLHAELDALDMNSLRELQRLLRDLDAERRMVIQRARATPWRVP